MKRPASGKFVSGENETGREPENRILARFSYPQTELFAPYAIVKEQGEEAFK